MATGHDTHALAAIAVAFTKLPQWMQIATIVVSLLSIGAAGAMMFSDFADLDPRVTSLERAHVVNDSMHRNLDARLSWVESDARLDRIRIEGKIDRLICFSEADRGERSYETCID